MPFLRSANCQLRPFARYRLACVLLLVSGVPHAFAEDHGLMTAHDSVEMSDHGRHHLSILAAKTRVNGADELGPTLGVDYEYRINPLLGVGAVLERAFGSVDATSFFAVADIHLWRGLAIQTGPGFERVDGETKFAGRLGLLYELEFKSGVTVSPQLHLDVADENSLVFGFAVGRSF